MLLRTDLNVHVVQVACSDANTIVCDTDGSVWVAGQNLCGQCGVNASLSDISFEFVQIDVPLDQKTSGKSRQKSAFTEKARVCFTCAATTIHAHFKGSG